MGNISTPHHISLCMTYSLVAGQSQWQQICVQNLTAAMQPYVAALLILPHAGNGA